PCGPRARRVPPVPSPPAVRAARSCGTPAPVARADDRDPLTRVGPDAPRLWRRPPVADRSRVPGLRRSVRTAVTWRYLDAALSRRSAETGRASLDVVDAGGGTGGFAVPIAEAGHRVVVVDPSPDALAALERRAGEAGVTDRVTA